MPGRKILKQSRGFTLVEFMFVSITVAMLVGAILGTWIFMQRTWTIETVRTNSRVDMIKALETLRNDLRLSSLTYMSFYPEGQGPYTAVSLPVANRDLNGFFSLEGSGKIDWDQTVVYHLFQDAGGVRTLRRTVIDSRDNTMDREERYSQLENIALEGQGEDDVLTDTEFLLDIETFEISTLAPIIDFYEDSNIPMRRGKVLFGWVKLAPGEHTFKFEVIGKNDLSSGFSLGFDNIMIEPSGSIRDAEYYCSSYAPEGMLTESAGSAQRVLGLEWSNSNYLEFDADGVNSYIEIADYYDLWRESAFEQVSLNNTRKDGEEVRISLDLPNAFDSPEDVEEPENIKWFAHQQAEDTEQEGHDGYVNPGGPDSSPTGHIVVRTLIKRQSIDLDPASSSDSIDLVRVKFAASDEGELRIERAYITRRDMSSVEEYDGLTNIDPGSDTPDKYHMHQQLFFRDISDIDGDGDVENVIPQLVVDSSITERSVWSEWTAFPLVVEDSGTDIDYFVTFVIDDITKAECKYWEDSASSAQTFYGEIDAGEEIFAGTPNWSVLEVAGDLVVELPSEYIFAVKELDMWGKTGTAEAKVFDTTIFSPEYNQIIWSEYKPTGTSVSVKARTGSSIDMVDASQWVDVSDLSIDGTGRYLQFLASLSSEPFWSSGTFTLSYSNYIIQQRTLEDYEFPAAGSGVRYITDLDAPWIDDIAIDWPGTERICAVTGYVAKKNDYGQAKLTVDDEDLVKILSVHVKTDKQFYGRMVENENYVEIEPRNTGK